MCLILPLSFTYLDQYSYTLFSVQYTEKKFNYLDKLSNSFSRFDQDKIAYTNFIL